MIFQWLDHEKLRPLDQLLLSLYDHGAFSARQFCALSGWRVAKMRMIIYRLRKKQKEESWIKTEMTSYGEDSSYYRLGEHGLKYASQLRGEPAVLTRLRSTQMQHLHLLGLNDILIRLVQKEQSHQMVWLQTREASDYLYRLCCKQMKRARTQLIQPDAFMVYKGGRYWIEYDRSTEGPRVIEKKMRQYIKIFHVLRGIGADSTVAWITTTNQRKKYLQQIWESINRDLKMDISMHFFQEGEEISFFVYQK
ncbi:Replication-relaxation [Seinonella peptonophila]|uniref:Replication-relaxation n=1 Tax=Seinonella peptonophila TaxID=112248 RepID=A0A1M5A046_9BACL|nr:replication-relaxation family protein [Seinonella peptonophila]SHF23266.1 Replication-relaxation [Seinonella peptonophila]